MPRFLVVSYFCSSCFMVFRCVATCFPWSDSFMNRFIGGSLRSSSSPISPSSTSEDPIVPELPCTVVSISVLEASPFSCR